MFLHAFLGTTAWMPQQEDLHQWMVIRMEKKSVIVAIATQGDTHWPAFVSEYFIQYSTNGDTWQSYYKPGLGPEVLVLAFMFLCSCHGEMNEFTLLMSVARHILLQGRKHVSLSALVAVL